MNSTSAATGSRPPFTASQWQELEHQALIFKYLMAGLPVPSDLVLPIRKSFESMSARFFHPSTMGYCSFYGKKVDPEPGRCKRTDGKKWRCSKDAYADSKYCERHMHRGRNRSRKPVETQTISPSSSTVTSLTATGSSSGSAGGGGGSSGGGFQSLPLHSISNPQAHCSGSNLSQLQMEHVSSYGIGSKDYRYLHGLKSDVDEHSFFSEASGSLRGIGMDSSLDSTWRLMPSRVSSFPPSKSRNGSILEAEYPHQLHSLQDLSHETITASLAKQQQHCFFGNEFGSSEPVTVKQEVQSLRPFFDEWPKTRDSWSDLEDERSNRTSFSTTQLSISIPMASSDFSAASSQSPNDD
ncbi:growth-regulating factor 3-like [Macadamia integrifolia]|uniref:growth-regulating factor 3-like n=1 Tax=Macadamia integrifolia TaxID=60698 RepID=UPI001C4E4C4A|nr:growth-regulating factor 3-like [Macadamia integrifolia]